jgi:3-dehydroquinate dehydratase/shikimate dehydrogenase
VITGVEMFVHQAARQFEIWTGKPAPWDEMLRVVAREIEDRAARNGQTANETKRNSARLVPA